MEIRDDGTDGRRDDLRFVRGGEPHRGGRQDREQSRHHSDLLEVAIIDGVATPRGPGESGTLLDHAGGDSIRPISPLDGRSISYPMAATDTTGVGAPIAVDSPEPQERSE